MHSSLEIKKASLREDFLDIGDMMIRTRPLQPQNQRTDNRMETSLPTTPLKWRCKIYIISLVKDFLIKLLAFIFFLKQ